MLFSTDGRDSPTGEGAAGEAAASGSAGVSGAASRVEHGGGVDREWLHRFALAARTLTLSTASVVNSCVYTTRVALAALEQVGVTAKAAPVFVSVMNMEAYRLAEERVPVAQWPHAAHSVGVNETSPLSRETGWNGHLVLIVRAPERPRLLIDLTADQFSRPIRNLIVNGPIFMDIPSSKPWTPRDPLITVAHNEPDGSPATLASYWPMPSRHPEATRWKSSPDWTMPDEVVNQYADYILRMTDDPTLTPVPRT